MAVRSRGVPASGERARRAPAPPRSRLDPSFCLALCLLAAVARGPDAVSQLMWTPLEFVGHAMLTVSDAVAGTLWASSRNETSRGEKIGLPPLPSARGEKGAVDDTQQPDQQQAQKAHAAGLWTPTHYPTPSRRGPS